MTETQPEIRKDELSRRMFFIGCLGLPWLWIVHTFWWHGVQRAADQALLDADEATSPPAASNETTADGQPSEEEIAANQRSWVRRARNSSIIVSASWVIWVLIVQVFLSDVLPNSFFIRSPDWAEQTGW